MKIASTHGRVVYFDFAYFILFFVFLFHKTKIQLVIISKTIIREFGLKHADANDALNDFFRHSYCFYSFYRYSCRIW
jgi:hypothetical protein